LGTDYYLFLDNKKKKKIKLNSSFGSATGLGSGFFTTGLDSGFFTSFFSSLNTK
jgi:hypothetical protein